MWSIAEIVSMVRDQFETQERDLCDQQAVRGLDSMREIDLHPLIAQSFSENHGSAIREAHYPSSESVLPSMPSRARCDLVLLAERKKSLFDHIDAHKTLRSASGTLFEPVAALPQVEAHQCHPSDAYWMEIKIVAQHRYIDGVPIPNPKYAHDLLTGPRDDVVKLAADPLIRHAGVLVVLFTELSEAGVHDLSISMREMIDQDLPVGMPEYETLPIRDLCGNAFCTLGLIPVRL